MTGHPWSISPPERRLLRLILIRYTIHAEERAFPARDPASAVNPLLLGFSMKVNLIYGTDTGNTRAVAKKIAKKLPDAVVRHIGEASREDFEGCDLLILGAPTCGLGDLPDDWGTGLSLLSSSDLTAKKVALFGTGDQMNYPDTFADAMGTLYDTAVARGADVIGQTDPDGYEFDGSTALRDGKFVGLVLDQDNQANKTEGRIDSWVGKIL